MGTREPFPAANLLRAMAVTTTTAQYPYAGSGNVQALMYLGLGLTGESGEVAEQIKKMARDDGGMVTEQRRMRLFGEIGDVIWYWLRLCDELGFDPNEVIAANQTKLKRRKDDGTIQGDGEDGQRIAAPTTISEGIGPSAESMIDVFYPREPSRPLPSQPVGGEIIDSWPGEKA